MVGVHLALAVPVVGTRAEEAPSPDVPATSGPSAEALAERLAAYVRPLDEAGELSGGLLVARGDDIVFERAFGMASYELQVPNTQTTRFGVASITKPITVLVTIRLIELGKLGLQDPLSKWLPGFPKGHEITVEHLVRHRAGLPHRVTTDAQETVPRSAADMVALAKTADLLFEPGSRSVYSSAGYSVLARVLELAGGKSWAELVQEHVLAPVGAVHTAHSDHRRLMPGRAQSYFRGPKGPLPAPLKDLSFLVGAGSVFSTPRDLVAIQRAILDGSFGEMARRALVEEASLDWSGITNGFRAFADYHGKADLTVIWTGNLFTGAADLLRRDVPRIAAGEDVEAPSVPQIKPVALAPELARRYEGIYRLRPGAEEQLRMESTLVTLGDWVLIPTSDTTFFSPQDYNAVRVVTGDDGAVEALAWETGGEPLRFPRVGDLPGDYP